MVANMEIVWYDTVRDSVIGKVTTMAEPMYIGWHPCLGSEEPLPPHVLDESIILPIEISKDNFVHDRNNVVIVYDNGDAVWYDGVGKILGEASFKEPRVISIRPDGVMAAAVIGSKKDGQLVVYELIRVKGKKKLTFQVNEYWKIQEYGTNAVSLTWSSDGQFLAIVNDTEDVSERVQVYNVWHKMLVYSVLDSTSVTDKFLQKVRHVYFSPDGKYITVASKDMIWTMEISKVLEGMFSNIYPTSSALSYLSYYDGTTMFGADKYGDIQVFEKWEKKTKASP
jgi:WD40 repeat protein